MKREIRLSPGSNLESVVNTLLEAKARGESVYCEIYGHILDSDTVSMDSAFIEVTGQTKADFDKAKKEWLENCKRKQADFEKTRKEWFENYDREQKESKKRAKNNIPNWIEKGQALIFPERYAEWEKCVVTCASGFYHGLELDIALKIMTALEKGASIEEAKQILNAQEYPGAIKSIVINILFEFSSKGPEFFEATFYGEISPKNKQILEEKKQENAQLIQANGKKTSGPKL